MTDGVAPYATPGSTVDDVLTEMASRAAVIFTGTVSAVKKGTDDDLRGNAAASVVEVHFLVDHMIVGVADGSTYILREWAGLWRDSPRFMPGQRVLALLHSAGPGGLSSPVDGLDGIIPIKATGRPVDTSLTALSVRTATSDMQEDAVDMRWLQAKTLRTQTFSDAATAAPGETFVGGLVTAPPSTSTVTASASTTVAQPSASAALSHVLGLLSAFQQTRSVSH